MPELRGLTGVKGDALPCQHVASVEQVLSRMRTKRRAVTAAGPEGALNVWRDDAGRLRSNFCRYRSTVDEAVHEDFDSLHAWLNVWWQKMGRDVATNDGGAHVGSPK